MRETALTPKTSYTATYTDTASTPVCMSMTGEVVRIVSTTDCFVKIAATSTAATTGGMFLPAFAPEYVSTKGVAAGSAWLSAIRSATNGTIYATVMD